MKRIRSFLFLFLTFALLSGCAVRPPLPDVRTITETNYVVVQVPDSYFVATQPPKPISIGCSGPTVDWKECAASRAKSLAETYGAIGQCNADKIATKKFIADQTVIVEGKNKKSKP